MTEVPLVARIPAPAHVRAVALSAFTVGLGAGFLGSLIYRHASPTPLASEAVAAAAGAFAALLPGRWFSRSAQAGAGMRRYLAACGTGAGVGLLVLALAGADRMAPAALFLLGLGAGGALRLAVWLVLATDPPKPAGVLLGLWGASFGLGGLAANLAALTAVSVFSVQSVVLFAASVPALTAVVALGTSSQGLDLPGRVPPWQSPPGAALPRSVLLAASLLLQSSACAIVAVWLTAYLSLGLGLSLAGGASVLAGFWLALAVGWAASGRLPPIGGSPVPLAVPAGLAFVGVFLLGRVSWAPAAATGAALLGLGMGVLFPVALREASWPSGLWRCRWVALSLQSSLAASLLLGWPVGLLVASAGIDALPLAVLGCFGGALAALLAMVGEYRLAGDPAST